MPVDCAGRVTNFGVTFEDGKRTVLASARKEPVRFAGRATRSLVSISCASALALQDVTRGYNR